MFVPISFMMSQDSCRPPVVLVVENNRQVLEVLGDLITDQGWTPITTPTLKGAMRSFSAQPVDAIVTDFELDDGNSLALLEMASRCTTHRVPALVISSYASQNLRDEVKRAGAVDLLEKPFRLETLTARLEHEFASAPGHTEQANATPVRGQAD